MSRQSDATALAQFIFSAVNGIRSRLMHAPTFFLPLQFSYNIFRLLFYAHCLMAERLCAQYRVVNKHQAN